jgi:hypothetical protein
VQQKKANQKNAHTTASNTTVATTLPLSPSRHQISHYRHTSQQPPSARRVLSRCVTTLPRSLDNFLDVFLYFLAATARRLQKAFRKRTASPRCSCTFLCAEHTWQLRFVRSLCLRSLQQHYSESALREISHLVVSVLMNDPPILSSCHSCYPLCFPRVCLKSGVSKSFIIWNEFTLRPRYAHQ